MLAIKTILSSFKKLPTIIFDEIDTGVSGKISDQIAAIMADVATCRALPVSSGSLACIVGIAPGTRKSLKVYPISTIL